MKKKIPLSSSTALTSEELKSLDSLIKDMENNREAKAVGIFPAVIAGFW